MIIVFLKVYTDIEIGGNYILAYFFHLIECNGGDSTPGPIFWGEILCGGKLYATTPAH